MRTGVSVSVHMDADTTVHTSVHMAVHMDTEKVRAHDRAHGHGKCPVRVWSVSTSFLGRI